MRVLLLTALAGIAAASAVSLAQSQPSSSAHPSEKATLCLDGIGVNHAPTCHSQSASRFATPPDICMCDGPYRQVDAPYCAPGEKEPADSADYDRARAKAAEKGSSLFGATYKGQSMCVELRR